MRARSLVLVLAVLTVSKTSLLVLPLRKKSITHLTRVPGALGTSKLTVVSLMFRLSAKRAIDRKFSDNKSQNAIMVRGLEL